jgi:hypothetical protein
MPLSVRRCNKSRGKMSCALEAALGNWAVAISSADLRSCDVNLWGVFKDRVYLWGVFNDKVYLWGLLFDAWPTGVLSAGKAGGD